MIKAPFNFVPLADKVYFPDWATKISQDKPFADGISGYMDLTITARTPIFVRNGHSKEEQELKTGDYLSFSQTPDGKYFIPSTTVKGAIRNVLEIMSFGKMNLDKNAMFAQREWDNNELYPIKNPNEQRRICCGWLISRDGKYYIKKCAGLYRINHKRIDEYFRMDLFRNTFSKDRHIDLNKDQKIGSELFDPKTAAYKYRLLQEKGISKDKLRGITFRQDEEFAVPHQENRYLAASSGDIKGTIVLTGQPDLASWHFPRRIGDGKFYEFIFDDTIEKEIPISSDMINHYMFIYQESPDWKSLKDDLEKTGMPVFFRERNNMVFDWGLALLYRLPYENSPADLEKSGRRYEKHSSDECDLAECIFGYTRRNGSLRGRVQFSNFISQNAEPDQEYTLVLNSPKASYYPIYIQQDGNKDGMVTNYYTYNNGRLSGWKRYHVRTSVWQHKADDPKINTTIYPLKANSVFSGRVYFHNLKPVELGALLSALTFHGDAECYHQIGQAKPYGFGKVSITLNNSIHLEEQVVGYSTSGINYFLSEYEKLMKEAIGNWIGSDQMVQLFNLSCQEVSDEEIFKYMTLSIDPRVNEFDDSKIAMEYLRLYTAIKGATHAPKSVISSDEKELDMVTKKLEELKSTKQKMADFASSDYASALSIYEIRVKPLSEELISSDIYQKFKSMIDPDNVTNVVPPQKPVVTGSLTTFLKDIKPSSSGQLAGQIKKGLKNGCTCEDSDIPMIAEKWEALINTICHNQTDRDRWKDIHRWNALRDVLPNEEMLQKVFDIVCSKL